VFKGHILGLKDLFIFYFFKLKLFLFCFLVVDFFFGGMHRLPIKSAPDTFLEGEKISKIFFSWYF
jgi:hypothetical protein